MESKETKDVPVSFREGVRGIWRQVRRYRGKLTLLVILGLISAATNGFVPYITGRFFDALIGLSHGTPAGTIPLWAYLLSVWAGVQIIANGTDFFMDRKRREIDSSLQPTIQGEGFIHLLKLPLSYHADEHVNATISKINMASWHISSIVESIMQIAPQFLSVIIGIILAASISLPMAGVLAGGVLVYALMLLFMLRPIAEMQHRTTEYWGDAWDTATSAIQQVPSVKQAVAEEYEIEKTRIAFEEDIPRHWYAIGRIWSNTTFFQRSIVFATQAIIFIASANSVANGLLTIGDLIALNGYALLFFGPFISLGSSWQIFQNGITSAGQLERIFLKEKEDYHPTDAIVPTEHSGRVVFDHVSFRYDTGQNEVLSDISFTVNPGEVVALVGESGGGKSTSVSLISGYYFPSEGSVSIDGVDTRRWDLSNLRKRIAIVPQEVALFNDTIRKNICYGSFDASEKQIIEAAREAHIDEYINSLPDGYQTLVGERGVKLSVGQKQRIAIARAILRDPEILILDEPTSALDSETEQFVTEALGKLMHGRTTFIIAHRLSTVRKAGKILVLKEGRVVETGSHQELTNIVGGVYRHLYELHIGLSE